MLILDQETINLIWVLHSKGFSKGIIARDMNLGLTRVKDILAGRTYVSMKPEWAEDKPAPHQEKKKEPDPVWDETRV